MEHWAVCYGSDILITKTIGVIPLSNVEFVSLF